MPDFRLAVFVDKCLTCPDGTVFLSRPYALDNLLPRDLGGTFIDTWRYLKSKQETMGSYIHLVRLLPHAE